MARFLSIRGRAGMGRVNEPIARALLRVGLTPDSMTIIGTVASVVSAVTLFPTGHLLIGALLIWLFVMFDMLDGTMARARGGGTRYGAVLDATCDRIADGAIFAALGWWSVVHTDNRVLFVGLMICLVTSQVISYAKARAEASGLNGNGGLIERPERLIIILVGAGFTGMGLPWAVHVATWVLAVGSVVTVGQRMLSISRSPGARDLLPLDAPAPTQTGEQDPTPVSLAERAADLGYGAGWSLVRRLPEPWVRKAFDAAGGRAGGDGGPQQLRRNLSRVLGVDPDDVPDQLVRAATRSYARYWREAFRLPSMDFAQAASRVHVAPEDLANFEEAYARGKGVVFALPHSGNWDMAGVWLVNRIGGFSTVAERLKPESLFERFVAYRESLGFEIFPLSGGETPPFGLLAERLRAGRVVCLLAERDLAEHGVPVTFFGEPTRMPAGPAKLAIETGAALLPVHHWFTDTHGSQISCDPPVDVSGGVRAATQAMADVFARNIAAHPQDWHMLQPLWEADWSHRRRDRLGVTDEEAS